MTWIPSQPWRWRGQKSLEQRRKTPETKWKDEDQVWSSQTESKPLIQKALKQTQPNHCKCTKRIRTGEHKLQPSSSTSQASLPRVAYPVQRLLRWGSRRSRKNGSFHQAPQWQSSSLLSADACTLLTAAQTLIQDYHPSRLESQKPPGGEQIFSNIRQELPQLNNRTSKTLQWIPSQDTMKRRFRTEWQQRLNIGTDVVATLSWRQWNRRENKTLSGPWPPPQTENPPLWWMPQTPATSNSPALPSIVWDARWPFPVDANGKLWRLVETLWRAADFALLTKLKIYFGRCSREEKEVKTPYQTLSPSTINCAKNVTGFAFHWPRDPQPWPVNSIKW